MALRKRMLVVTVALFVVGLGGANFATYHFLSAFLVDRIDDQLRAATPGARPWSTRPAGCRPRPASTLAGRPVHDLRFRWH